MSNFMHKLREWDRISKQPPDTLDGFLLPAHHYLGPGNPLDNGLPVDRADAIALAHDKHYANAQIQQDIRDADVEAIRDFGAEFINSGSLCAGLGALGIAGKYAVESVIGVQYPQMPPTKRGINAGAPAEASGKKLRSGNQYPNMQQEAPPTETDGDAGEEMDVGDNTGGEAAVGNPGEPGGRIANSGQPGGKGRGGAGGMGMLRMFKCPKNKPALHVIHHEEYVNFWGFGWHAGSKDANMQLMTSLGYLPVGMTGFWMSPADIDALPSKTHVSVKDVELTAIACGLTTSFETATTITGTASAHHWVQGAVNIGLNHSYPIVPMTPTINNMRITDYTTINGVDYIDRRWGSQNYTSTTAAYLYPATYKIPRDCRYYTSIFYGRETVSGAGSQAQQGVDSTRTTGGWNLQGSDYVFRGRPSLEHELADFTAGDCAGETILHYKYKPEDGHMWDSPSQLPRQRVADDSITLMATGPHENEPVGRSYVVPVATEPTNVVPPPQVLGGQQWNQYVTRQYGWTPLGYALAPLEKQSYKQIVGTNTDRTGNATIQPSCHIGLYPVFPNAPGTATENPINVKLTCKLLTKIVLSVGGHSMYTWMPTRDHNSHRTYAPWEAYNAGNRDSKRTYTAEPTMRGAIVGAPSLTTQD